MKRRQALFGILRLSAGLVTARNASAQRAAKIPVIGLLDASERVEYWAAFRQQLQKLCYVEGKNIAFEARFAGGKPEQLLVLAQELTRLDVAVIVSGALQPRWMPSGPPPKFPLLWQQVASR